MTTVVFIHGTGVRELRYGQALDRIRRGLSRHRPDLTVSPCYWGGTLGSRLGADGRSVPGLGPADDFSEQDRERARWAMLYDRPLYELELLEVAGGRPPRMTPGGREPGAELAERLEACAEQPEVRGAFEAAGLDEGPSPAVAAVAGSRACRAALARLEEDTAAVRGMLARAVTAQALAQVDGGPGTVDPGARDAVVGALLDALGGDEYGIGEVGAKVLRTAGALALQFGGDRLVVNRRGDWTEERHPLAGDVMAYLARGGGIRDFIAERVRAVEGPVALLAHSLGGVAAVDLLVQQELPQVELLVTVGSQAPFLYELDALPCLPFPTALPARFPRWVNVFDRRDLLSYLARPVFPGRAEDVEVDNGQPVTTAHSGYWNNESIYRLLASEVRA
ncbi:hypothetical protein [Wenjunlia tyrosinilytica]|uniref:Uncharacterized protein n=1 Tax=Wenjunlia tyrosinilytica TaxID=1544741 RepID=A0A917ZVH6_9ACTN|nr:hypothetical protein [Wenjunlia tyrosinilytica]GGO92357.1 hypothetical protein GCM10012280_42350 [Wenjunlia tyrosinilytica]